MHTALLPTPFRSGNVKKTSYYRSVRIYFPLPSPAQCGTMFAGLLSLNLAVVRVEVARGQARSA